MVLDPGLEEERDISVPGIIYLSTIPNGMNVSIVSDIMRQFGEIGRVYLIPKKKKAGKYRQYEEGWVEFLNNKIAKRVSKRLNCTEVLGAKRNPWFGELWNIRFLKDTSWNDLFGADREEEEQRRTAHDRDIVVAKHQSRQFAAALGAKKLEKRMKQVKGKRFNERKPLKLSRRQKLTEDEIKEKLAHSSRTPPDGCLGFSAVSNPEFMSSLFAGGL
ncbi:Pre-rRNA-processing protein [Schistosoma japonicum]|uniref:Activator of basal transcription 1 n=1 Tax=Schistosoma japonicum TaxID=6182 RepID=Q5DD53_SCHJA|nr:SJCHGC09116 protein [Schistosoma japonicum]KAH8871952.1 Activator of basal transcription 1 [Schistosoma japonicum]KAH8871953.1 Activator of basal transcription 1 [Schistosoma japonicum]TNN17562.1 Pre-rRNA-processing protein [Schistosoma japonicum]TNN17563.1 Pre-rRNA-processing protein [Schistosoma japonicum]